MLIILLGVLLFIVFILLLLLLLVLRLTFEGHLSFNDINLQIKVTVLKITVFKYKVPHTELLMNPLRVKVDKENKDPIKDNKEKETLTKDTIFETIEKLDHFMNSFEEGQMIQGALRGIRFQKLKWHTLVGLGEADLSAMAVGGVWIVKSQLFRLVNQVIPLPEKLDLKVNADFQNFNIGTDFSCMISFRLGKAIMTMYRLKQWKGRQS